ncbi:MAG: dephospho-CoA kinase [Ruminococcus sp.]|nr:dephospho-CoA kinase [Ruminococcus sp.]
MKKYKLIGLTGATGAGKSEVAQIFRENGYEVIYADFLAREIMNNPAVLSALRSSFGEDVVQDNVLDRRLLAQRAFRNSETKKLLDRITHPFISTLFIEELKKLSSKGAKRILFDASQLFESGLDVICDCVISVTAPEQIRLRRITERDGLTEQQARERMSVQYTDDYFRENSDFTIENNDEFSALKREVIKFIRNSEVRFGSDENT